MKKYTPHPAADAFPMLSKEELIALAADIKENGLIHPIVVKGNVLVDGRNRVQACKLAKVEPEVIEYEGDDDSIVGFIVSSNLQQRHLTQGQRALVAAKLVSITDKPRGQMTKLANLVGVHRQTISEARTILQYAPTLADDVLDPVPDPEYRVTFAKALLSAKTNKENDEKGSKKNTATNKIRKWVKDRDANVYDLAMANELTWAAAKLLIKEAEKKRQERIGRRVMYLREMLGGMTTLKFVADNLEEGSEHHEECMDILEALDRSEKETVLKVATTWKGSGNE